MSEPVDWMPDGTPYSPRFGDRYHSESGSSLEQARGVFLRGCGLPGAWAGQPQWRILETGFGLGLNFLVTWAAWRSDPQRCTLLHFVSAEAWPVSAADLQRVNAAHPELALLADELHRQWWGLLPGVHRLSFEGGRVLLTLYIGDAQAMLRRQQPTLTVDAVYLDGFSPQRNPDLWSPDTLKAVARCCRRGTRLATWTIARPVRELRGFRRVHLQPGECRTVAFELSTEQLGQIVDSHDDAVVMADSDRLMQVLTNLISNAVKFSPASWSSASRRKPSIT